MKKIFISILLISFVFNFVNAEQVKQTNKKELSKEDEEFLKEFMKSDNELKQEKIKTAKMVEKTKSLDKLEKTVDELSNKMMLDKK